MALRGRRSQRPWPCSSSGIERALIRRSSPLPPHPPPPPHKCPHNRHLWSSWASISWRSTLTAASAAVASARDRASCKSCGQARGGGFLTARGHGGGRVRTRQSLLQVLRPGKGVGGVSQGSHSGRPSLSGSASSKPCGQRHGIRAGTRHCRDLSRSVEQPARSPRPLCAPLPP